MLRRVRATRYVAPLREGGSLPGLMEADDLGTYVVKFRGAGQGPAALVAEVVAGGLARRLGLPVPELVVVDVDPALAVAEPDEEVQDLLRASAGPNLGVDYLPGALDLDAATFPGDPALAGDVVWFDALVGNVDRSWRNPNLLRWHGRPYLIDHGASLTFHHRWDGAAAAVGRRYDVADHVLVGVSPDVAGADRRLADAVTPATVADAVGDVPAEWLGPDEGAAETARAAYRDWLLARVAARSAWLPALLDDVRSAS